MRTLTIATALTTLLMAAAALILMLAYDGATAGPVPDVVVNTIHDPGDGICDDDCTLREAIPAANLTPGTTIVFNIPGCPPACTISLVADDLPPVSANGTVIDGTSEPDYNNTPIVIVDGSVLASGEAGIYLWANNVIVRGLVIQNFPGMGAHAATGITYDGREVHDSIIRDNGTYGIGLNGADAAVTNNVIEGNGDEGIGAAFAGGGARLLVEGNEVSNNGGSGIRSGIADTTVTDNVVSGNGGRGIDVGGGAIVATGNSVTNNGQLGLFVIGDTLIVTGNMAAGNAETGIVVGGGPATVTENTSNNNGFGPVGAGPAGIDPGDGFEIAGSSDGKTVRNNVASGNSRHGFAVFDGNNTIGGTSAQDANVATGNGGAGVYVDDSDATGNSILRNSIYDNDGLGIDLDPIGLTVNDPLDVDVGANNRQNFPVIITAVPGSVSVTGVLNSTPLSQFRIEFFHNDACDPTEFGEGKTFIGFVDVETDAAGNAPFAANFASGPGAGFATATATHQGTGDTSEFSNCIEIESPATPTPSPSPTAIPTASPTPTSTPTPSGTVTPTPTPTSTATPSATPNTDLVWGDADCDGDVTSRDNQALLRKVLQQNPLSQTEPCPDLGETVDGRVWGDWDCDGVISSRDNQALLRAVLQQTPLSQTEPCPDIGSAA